MQPYCYPHEHYGTFYYTIWLASLFLFVLHIPVRNTRLAGLIKQLAENTFTVYLGHLPVLVFITTLWPLQSTKVGLLYIAALFVGLELVACLFRKMPLLRHIV